MHRVHKRGQNAFSLLELLTVISIIGILAALLLTAMASAKAKSRQTACLNNLHQIGLGFAGFALDHDGKYPMDLPERFGGSMEYNQSFVISNTPFSRDFRHFLALSNEVPNAKIMVCPADRSRTPAANYRAFSQTNVSYWANTRAQPHATLSTLAGDWNAYSHGATNDISQINFGREVHRRQGSVLFADGRVEITRTLAVSLPPPSQDTIAITSTTKGPEAPTTQRPNTRPHVTPTSPPPVATAQTPTSSTPLATPRTGPGEDKQPPTAEAIKTNEPARIATTTQVDFGGGYRRTTVGGGTDPGPATVGDTQLRTISQTGPAPSPAADESEPWDTSGFRFFKALAFVSYLISLLWALVALLLLYLKSRLAQRAREREAAQP